MYKYKPSGFGTFYSKWKIVQLAVVSKLYPYFKDGEVREKHKKEIGKLVVHYVADTKLIQSDIDSNMMDKSLWRTHDVPQ